MRGLKIYVVSISLRISIFYSKHIGSLWSINTAEFHPLGFGRVRDRVGPIFLVWPIFSSRGIDLIFI